MEIGPRAVRSYSSDLGEGPRFTHYSTCLSVVGNYSFVTNRNSLCRTLRRTELPWTVLEKFETGIYKPKGANLPAVEVSEKTLTQIGYFID